MKRIFILVAIALLTVGAVFAEESVLIDFSNLKADLLPKSEGGEDFTQNKQTVMDFSNTAGSTYTEEQRAVMKTSLAITNWEILLASSARNVENTRLSYTKESPSKQWDTVMGVRIHFPVNSYNSWARIKPPFEIPAYEPTGEVDDQGNFTKAEDSNGTTTPSRFENGYGVVKNVGTIKSVAANVYGLNFPHSLSIVLLDDNGNEKLIPLGYLRYEGWAELRWDNPAYVSEVRNRELRLYPMYPATQPFIKFGGFVVQRDGANDGGDFIGYFKDVKVIYDKAVLEQERDIADEPIWNIIEDRETAKKTFQMKRFGQSEVLRYLENQRQATEKDFTPTPTGEGGGETQ